jgi:hypothetical protein
MNRLNLSKVALWSGLSLFVVTLLGLFAGLDNVVLLVGVLAGTVLLLFSDVVELRNAFGELEFDVHELQGKIKELESNRVS